ncbi:MAG: nuclear transport factor 2 family protein [Acidimicrobiia bacterium]|nr:nuclear transport factor 2 family protein [Acidimicrobiia bacterium]
MACMVDQTIFDTVRSYADAWAAGDLVGVLDAYHDDFVLHYFGESDLAGDHEGKDAAVTALVAATERTARRLLEVEDVLAGERFGAIIAREEVGVDDRRVIRRVLVFTVADDQLAECWLYDEDQRAIDQLWSVHHP